MHKKLRVIFPVFCLTRSSSSRSKYVSLSHNSAVLKLFLENCADFKDCGKDLDSCAPFYDQGVSELTGSCTASWWQNMNLLVPNRCINKARSDWFAVRVTGSDWSITDLGLAWLTT